MSPFPTAMALDLDPDAETELALHELDALLLADTINAAGAVIGRNLCETVSIIRCKARDLCLE